MVSRHEIYMEFVVKYIYIAATSQNVYVALLLVDKSCPVV